MREIRSAKVMDIGDLDEKILFQRQIDVPDGGAGNRVSWTDFIFKNGNSTKWAHYDNTPGRSLSQIAGHMEFFDRVRFIIQDDNGEITQKPIGELRIVRPASGNNRLAYEITGINLVKGKIWFTVITCSGNQTEAI